MSLFDNGFYVRTGGESITILPDCIAGLAEVNNPALY